MDSYIKIIYIDSREQNQEFISLFIDMAERGGYECRMATLPFGDIKFQNIVIERKEINDYYSSVSSDRMWTQISHMRANPEYSSIIMLIGRIQDLWEITDIKVNVVMGSQKKITAMGIPLIWCFTNEEFIVKALELFEYATSTDDFVPIKRVEKNKKTSLFMALPEIGIVNAKKLMKEFDNMVGLACASKKEIQKIIGYNKGEKVFDAIHQ